MHRANKKASICTICGVCGVKLVTWASIYVIFGVCGMELDELAVDLLVQPLANKYCRTNLKFCS